MTRSLSIFRIQEVDPNERGRVLLLCGLGAAAVFALDLFVPLGVTEPVLYVAIVLLSLRLPKPRDTLMMTAVCTALTVLGYLFSPQGGAAWMALANRGLSLFAMWVTALLALQVKQSDQHMREKSQILTGVLHHMPAVVFHLDEAGYITQSVGKGLRRLGLKEEAMGRNALEPPPQVIQELTHMPPGQVVFYERHGTHDGQPWWFRIGLMRNVVESDISRFGFGLDITDLKKAERRLLAHHRVTDVLAQARSSLEEVTARVLEAICTCLNWPLGAMWQVDRTKCILRCVDVWHQDSEHLQEFEARSRHTTFAKGVGLPGRVWEKGEPVWLMDVAKDPNFPRAPIAAKEGLHTAFAFPVKLREEIYGVLEFFNREVEEPDPDLLTMFHIVGIQIGQFIERLEGGRMRNNHGK